MWDSEAMRIRLEVALAEETNYRSRLKEELQEVRDQMAGQTDELTAKMDENYQVCSHSQPSSRSLPTPFSYSLFWLSSD